MVQKFSNIWSSSGNTCKNFMGWSKMIGQARNTKEQTCKAVPISMWHSSCSRRHHRRKCKNFFISGSRVVYIGKMQFPSCRFSKSSQFSWLVQPMNLVKASRQHPGFWSYHISWCVKHFFCYILRHCSNWLEAYLKVVCQIVSTAFATGYLKSGGPLWNFVKCNTSGEHYSTLSFV